MERIAAPGKTTIFERMSRLAAERGAINLGQGFPDWSGPQDILDAAARALSERSSQYPPMRGLPELRRAIAGYYQRTQSLAFGEDEIVVTSGATEALAATLLALVQPGDEVILVQPLYDAYIPLVERAGGRAVIVDLEPPGWSLPIERLRAAVTDRTQAIVLNTPNNPTGAMLGMPELEAIAALCAERDLVLICDEVWEAMVMDGSRHISPSSVAGLRERCVKIGSAGKIFSLTGWKVGWICAAPPLASAIADVHQFLTFTTAPALQWAAAFGLTLPNEWHERHRAPYVRARQRLNDGLAGAGYCVLPGRATWFTLVDLERSGVALSDVEFCEAAIDAAGVAAIPVSAFYAQGHRTGYVRLCFAKPDDTIDAALERLARFRREMC